MTWARLDPGLPRKLDDLGKGDGLPDCVVRAHFEVLSALFDMEKGSARFTRRQLPRMTYVDDIDTASAAAVTLGIWSFDEHTGEYEVGGDWGGNTLRQSLAAQAKKKEDDRVAQQRKRDRAKKSPGVSTDVDADAGTEVGDDVAATLTNKQANTRGLEGEQEEPPPSLALVANDAMSARAQRHVSRGYEN